MRVIITGGAGFIGSSLIRLAVRDKNFSVLNLDKLTYAGHLESLESVEGLDNYSFIHTDICDAKAIKNILQEFKPDAIMHLAAESHVDRSIDGSSEFIRTNIVGTHIMLEEAKSYWQSLSENAKEDFRFLHISTDEVFGSLGDTGLFTEETSYDPRSPYSASKASSDHLVRAWFHTYGLPTIITNCSNNYGPFQFPEKLIPVVIFNAIQGNSIPVYGDGANIRDWLYVDDHANALLRVLKSGIPGETYNIGGHNEKSNLEVVHTICNILDHVAPKTDGTSYKEQVSFVKDRPGHDFRYAIDASKIERDLEWVPQQTFETGIKSTIDWYLSNLSWVEAVTDKNYDFERLGTKA